MSRLGPFDGYGRPRRRPSARIAPRHEVAAPPQFRTPDPPRKRDCPGHVAGTDSIGRMPIGDCGPDCLIRRHRLGIAVWDGERWT
jgi:hypothetical protein